MTWTTIDTSKSTSVTEDVVDEDVGVEALQQQQQDESFEETDVELEDTASFEEEVEETEEDHSLEGEEDTSKKATKQVDTKDKKFTGAEKRIKTLINKIKTVAREKDEVFSAREAELLNQIESLKGLVAGQGASYADVLVTKAKADMAAAKLRYKNARESLDSDAEMEALEEYNRANVNLMKAEEVKKKLPTQPTTKPNQVPYEEQRAVKMTSEWLEANPEVSENPRLAKLVASEAKKIEEEGFYTPGDFEYYELVNKAVNTRLQNANIKYRVKDILGLDDMSDYDDADEFAALEVEEKPKKRVMPPTSPSVGNKTSTQAQRRATTGVQTQPGGKQKVSLTAEEVKFARSFGVDPKIVLAQKAHALRQESSITGWSAVRLNNK